jgi:hypothetical protein
MLDEKFAEQNQTWSNIIQHNATISNMVFKRTQHVEHNNVGYLDDVGPTCCIRLNRP